MKKQQDMTTGTPWKLILLFAVPLFIGNVFQMLYNMVDTIVVGQFVGIKALAAVGASGPGYSLIIVGINGFCSGASVIIAQIYGSGDREMVRKAYLTTCRVLLNIGVVFTAVGLLLCGSLLRLLGTPEDVFSGAHTYLLIMSAGILATCLYNGMASFLRSVGNSLIPLIALVAASLLNIVLDLILVLAAGMGVAGVALATVISQFVSGLYCLYYINTRMPEFRFGFFELKVQPEVVREMERVALPATFSAVVVTVSTMFIQAAVNKYGSVVVGAYTVGNKVENICFCLAFAIGMATGIFCGQNIGAGKRERTILGFKAGIVIALVYSSVMGALAILFTPQLIRIFTSDPAVHEVAVPLVRITSAFGPVLGVVFILQHFLRNVSDVRPTVVMSFAEILSRGVLPFVLSAWIGYFGIWWATPIGWTLSLLIGLIRYCSGKWEGKVKLAAAQKPAVE